MGVDVARQDGGALQVDHLVAGGRVETGSAGDDAFPLEAQVDAMVASGWTPTAEALVDIMEHFQTTGADAPIEYECQIVYVEFPPEDVGEWHVEAIEPNIRTNGGSPVEQGTWSKIKAFFASLVD